MDIFEALLLLEGKADEQKLIDFAGKELAKQFLENRKKFKAPENDIYYWLKKPPEELKDFIDNYSSNTQTKKTQRGSGSKLVFTGENGDKIYFVTTYDAMKQIGKGTKWCIAGNYAGHEERGEEYFNDYIWKNNLNGGYYVLIDGNGDKYCFLVDIQKRIHSIWNAADQNIEPYLDITDFSDGVREFFSMPVLRAHIKKEDINGITLLSVEEAERLPESILKFSCDWWLRAGGPYKSCGSLVDRRGRVLKDGCSIRVPGIGVRPAIICNIQQALNLKVGDCVSAFDLIWQYIGDNMALLRDEELTDMAFRENEDWAEGEYPNDYEKSDVKKFLDNWLRKQMSKEN